MQVSDRIMPTWNKRQGLQAFKTLRASKRCGAHDVADDIVVVVAIADVVHASADANSQLWQTSTYMSYCASFLSIYIYVAVAVAY